jgi:hypothetical protein
MFRLGRNCFCKQAQSSYETCQSSNYASHCRVFFPVFLHLEVKFINISRPYADRLQTGRPKNLCSIPGRGKRFFSFLQSSDCFWDTSILLFNGYGFYLGVKRLGPEADHTLASNVEVKNTWSYICRTSSLCVMCCLM